MKAKENVEVKYNKPTMVVSQSSGEDVHIGKIYVKPLAFQLDDRVNSIFVHGASGKSTSLPKRETWSIKM